MLTDEPEVIRYGPLPYSGLLSTVCEAFECAPDVAERQDYETVRDVLEYRAAREAVRVLRSDDRQSAFRALQGPLGELLVLMSRAQRGEPLVRRAGDLEAVVGAYRDEDGEDGEDGDDAR